MHTATLSLAKRQRKQEGPEEVCGLRRGSPVLNCTQAGKGLMNSRLTVGVCLKEPIMAQTVWNNEGKHS
jgi:hypothetical protein